MRNSCLGLLILFSLFASGCASTCEFENTLTFMNKTGVDEVCIVMNEPADMAGQEFCVRKKPAAVAARPDMHPDVTK